MPLDAVALFDARSRAAGALDPPASRTNVEELCARLDNLPLPSSSPRPGAPPSRLRRCSSAWDCDSTCSRGRVTPTSASAPCRRRSRGVTISSSRSSKELFRRLAVFSEGAVLDAVETVCGAELDALLALVAQSLVRQAPTAAGEPRYWMLATIHEFAAARSRGTRSSLERQREAACG
jgi:hypothetical protein